MKKQKGFTLIELLVVIAVIGILASVVLVSLNSARTKGKEASIKSNLRNMIAAAELSYGATGDYSGACNAVQPMMDAIEKITAVAPKCFSFDNYPISDTFERWGVSATNTDKNKSWSVDGKGVVTWNTTDIGAENWNTANSSCETAGKKLPSIEQFKSLYETHTTTPSGFSASLYWSGTEVPLYPTVAYRIHMINGSLGNDAKSGVVRVRCVQ